MRNEQMCPSLLVYVASIAQCEAEAHNALPLDSRRTPAGQTMAPRVPHPQSTHPRRSGESSDVPSRENVQSQHRAFHARIDSITRPKCEKHVEVKKRWQYQPEKQTSCWNRLSANITKTWHVHSHINGCWIVSVFILRSVVFGTADLRSILLGTSWNGVIVQHVDAIGGTGKKTFHLLLGFCFFPRPSDSV